MNSSASGERAANLGRTGTRKGLVGTGAASSSVCADTSVLVGIGSNIRDKLLSSERKQALPGRRLVGPQKWSWQRTGERLHIQSRRVEDSNR
jgi:hypothetical protein